MFVTSTNLEYPHNYLKNRTTGINIGTILNEDIIYVQVEAETTKAYWETCNPKLTEALARPGRRLLRESRTHPITVHHAGRFFSHSFVLVTDALVHLQYSSFTTYPLATMWVEALPNSSSIQVSHPTPLNSKVLLQHFSQTCILNYFSV